MSTLDRTEEDNVPQVVGQATSTALPVLGRARTEWERDRVIAHLQDAARLVRRRDLSMVHAAGLGHIGGEFSVTDILVTLYLGAMNIHPERIDDPERDRLVLSKGHAAAALYSTLTAAGLLDPSQLETFMQPLSQLNGHPARTKVRAVEASTGPLGHGLPIAVGTAIAGELDGSERRTFVVLGDGEMQEGSNWEALMTAGTRRLSRLCVIIDRNGLQQGAHVAETNDLEPLADKLRAFGLDVAEVDGHDHNALLDAVSAVPAVSGRPTAIIAHTVKGHPITFMSDDVAWHHKVPSEDQVTAALAELEAR